MSAEGSHLDRDEPRPARWAVGLGVVSMSILLLEVSATRLLSFVSWHHFGFMVVSVAMLGLGAASVALSVSRRLSAAPLRSLALLGSVGLSASGIAGYLVVTWARFSPPRLPTDTADQALRLVATYAGLLVPFFAGGLVVAAVLSRRAKESAILYGADLVGAALGCLAGVALAGPLGLEQCLLAATPLSAVGAAIFVWPRRRGLIIAGLATIVAVGALVLVPRVAPARPAPGKALHEFLEGEQGTGRLVTSRNTPLGRVDVVEIDRAAGWSRNPRAPRHPLPEQLHLLIDGEADTPIARLESLDLGRLSYLDYLPSSFVFALRRPERALVLGAGGGQDVLSALRAGVRQIDAVEINPATVELMSGPLAAESGRVFQQRGVRLIRSEGRSFVRRQRGRYDVVQMGLVDTWAATSTGGMSLTENFLYTTDAFSDYLDALGEGGMVGITRWIHEPPRETLRLTVLAADALERRGVADPGRHIAVVGVGRVAALIVAREPLSDEAVGRVVALARQRRLDLHWIPGVEIPPERRSAFTRLLGGGSRRAMIERYPYDISPVTDDRPFFFDFNTRRDRGVLGLFTDLRGAALSGTATLTAVLLQAVVFSLLLLVLPVIMRRTRVRRDGWPLLAYFALTGTGFMFVEIPLLQRLTLIVGHPTLAVAMVLGLLLGASGAASLLSARITGVSRRRLVLALAALGVVIMVEALLGEPLGRAMLGLSPGLRPLLAASLVLPVGFLMGLPTPQGLRVAGARRSELLPLLWATTSFASVVGSVLAVMVSMHLGFAAALAAGALCYLSAAIFAPGASVAEA